MLWKHNIHIFGRHWSFLIRNVPEKTVFQGGIGNRCANGQYIVFLDYDNTPYNWLEDEIPYLQKRFGLGNAYVFQTKRGYHVIFLEKMSLGRVIQVLNTSSCDKNYKDIPLLYGRKMWVLRMTSKSRERIVFKSILPAKSSMTRSLPHKTFLQDRYGIKEYWFNINAGPFDKEESLFIATYHIGREND